MSAENNKRVYLRLQENLETVRTWPLFTGVNNLSEQIFSLSYAVGRPASTTEEYFATTLTNKENEIFLSALLSDQRLKYGNKADKVVRNLLGYSNSTGAISREFKGNTLSLHILINTEPISLDFLLISISKTSEGDRIEIHTSNDKPDIDDHDVSVNDYKPILEGLKKILDHRKQFKEYLTASA